MRHALYVVFVCVCLTVVIALPSFAQSWTHIGLDGKTVNAILVHPGDPDLIFAGAEDGLYRTTDGGTTWNPVQPGFLLGIQALCIHEGGPQHICAMRTEGDINDGVYRSTDAGVSWNRIFDLMCGTSLMGYSGLCAGALNDSGGGGVYWSLDGATWDTINEGLTNLDVLSLGAIYCFGDSLDVDFAGTRSGIFTRTSADTSWSWVGPATNAFFSDFGGGGYQPNAYAAWGNGSWSDGIYKTTDLGETWNVSNYHVYAQTVTTNPLNDLCVYAGHLDWGVLRSTDAGITWEEMNQGLTNLDVIELAFCAGDTTWLYAGTEGGGVFKFGLVPGAEETADHTFSASGPRLEVNYPNPFRTSTRIDYFLPAVTHVTLLVYDIRGARVQILADEIQQPGNHQIQWRTGSNSAGIYFCTLRAGDFESAIQMIAVE